MTDPSLGPASCASWHGTRAVSTLCLALAACTSRPAIFADQLPAMAAKDDQPVVVPARRKIPEAVRVSEVFLHRPMRNALDLSPFPESEDVNSLDEVVHSSWFDPHPMDLGTIARGPLSDGPPHPPFTVIPDRSTAVRDGIGILDARGLAYEIVVDPPDRPEMYTGAAAVSSRLLWAVGWRTPPAFVVSVRAEDFSKSDEKARDALSRLAAGPAPVGGYYRVAAVRWPLGAWVGQAAEEGKARDDPNDLIAHQDRRSLRSLQVVAAWLKLRDLGPAKTLDVYEGVSGRGHVVHYVVGLDDSLGAGDVVRRSDPEPEEGGGGPGMRLLTLGLAPNPPRPVTQTDVLAVGEIEDEVDPPAYWSGLPYAPVERIQPADGYWAAKRVASITSAALALCIDTGRYSDERARRRLYMTLEARRERILRYWYRQTTPLEFVSATRDAIVLRDEAIARGLASEGETSYEIAVLDDAGASLTPGPDVRPPAVRPPAVRPPAVRPPALRPPSDRIAIALPPGVAAQRYLIVRVLARRAGGWLSRPFEIHLKPGGAGFEVLGIRR